MLVLLSPVLMHWTCANDILLSLAIDNKMSLAYAYTNCCYEIDKPNNEKGFEVTPKQTIGLRV